MCDRSVDGDDFPDGAGPQAGGADLLLAAVADRDGAAEFPAIIAGPLCLARLLLPRAVGLQTGIAIGRNGRAADADRVLVFTAMGRGDGRRDGDRGGHGQIGWHLDHLRRRRRIDRNGFIDDARLLPGRGDPLALAADDLVMPRSAMMHILVLVMGPAIAVGVIGLAGVVLVRIVPGRGEGLAGGKDDQHADQPGGDAQDEKAGRQERVRGHGKFRSRKWRLGIKNGPAREIRRRCSVKFG